MAESENTTPVEDVAPVTTTTGVKAFKNQTAGNNKKPEKVKKPRRSLMKIAKEVISELKKVSWPKFNKVFKQTLIVIAVVIIFTVVLFGIDRLFSYLFTLLAG